jgi:hypothetical protein
MAKQAVVKQLESKQENRNESSPAHEQIAALAYSLWQARGCPEGSPEEDWLNAERALNEQQGLSTQESTAVSKVRQRH